MNFLHFNFHQKSVLIPVADIKYIWHEKEGDKYVVRVQTHNDGTFNAYFKFDISDEENETKVYNDTWNYFLSLREQLES